MVVHGVWSQVGWQNDIRELFGMEPTSPTSWPVILLTTVAVAALVLIVSRSLRVLFGKVAGWLGRHLPRRLAWVLGVTGLLVLFWVLLTGVLVKGFFAGANVMFSLRDTDTPPTVSQPFGPESSGSPASLAAVGHLGPAGPDLHRVGSAGPGRSTRSPGAGPRSRSGPTSGLKSADSLQARADLLLAELQRTGAFDRKVLVLATTTGTGFLDPRGVDPIEYMFNGDTAIAGVQYSYLPSWLSLLADKQAVRETSRVVFDTVHSYWASLPEESRPKLYLYGLSLGSYGVGSVLNSVSIVNEPIDGALMSGPPFVNELHKEIVANREPGTPPWQPIYREGRTVRFTAEESGFAKTPGPWGPTRLVYLQHNSDPVVFFAPELALQAAGLAGAGSAWPGHLPGDGLVPAGHDVAGRPRPSRRRQRPLGVRPPLHLPRQPGVLGPDHPARGLDRGQDREAGPHPGRPARLQRRRRLQLLSGVRTCRRTEGVRLPGGFGALCQLVGAVRRRRALIRARSSAMAKGFVR